MGENEKDLVELVGNAEISKDGKLITIQSNVGQKRIVPVESIAYIEKSNYEYGDVVYVRKK